tara:strand:- start:323 stop:802 length:480 start_codon:yes stop_codon:yes gene_type:complete
MQFRYLDTPIGRLLLAGDEFGLHLIGLPQGKAMSLPADWLHDDGACEVAATQLDEYFAGQRQTFDLELRPTGTEFQLAVLGALQNIPYGQTCTYSDIAKIIHRPRAVRAVGAANGRNPLPIVIPCHRVIGADGSLTGFGGGLPAKQWLLAHECGSDLFG